MLCGSTDLTIDGVTLISGYDWPDGKVVVTTLRTSLRVELEETLVTQHKIGYSELDPRLEDVCNGVQIGFWCFSCGSASSALNVTQYGSSYKYRVAMAPQNEAPPAKKTKDEEQQ